MEVINRGDITFGLSSKIRFRGTLDSRFVNKIMTKSLSLNTKTPLLLILRMIFQPEKGLIHTHIRCRYQLTRH